MVKTGGEFDLAVLQDLGADMGRQGLREDVRDEPGQQARRLKTGQTHDLISEVRDGWPLRIARALEVEVRLRMGRSDFPFDIESGIGRPRRWHGSS
jgi:hypothetical protein